MPTTAVLVQDCEQLATSTPLFRLSLAQNMEDLTACQRLRYLVFNCELGEGLTASEGSGLDRDPFDPICDHLMVHDAVTGQLVGTYRMQTGYRAKGNIGYYSEQLFDFGPFESIRGELLELGRACVHEDYRNTTALFLLWKGIASYAALCHARYLIGCSSLTSQNEAEGLRSTSPFALSISLSLPCKHGHARGTSAVRSDGRSRRCVHHGYFALTWRFPRACVVRRPSTANSRPSIFSRCWTCSMFPTVFVSAFSKRLPIESCR